MSAYHYVMIGYTHIDPVWLWKRAEGLQEVKASFASALDRMEEFPEFRFTQTSIGFLEWMKENCPGIYGKIRERITEGRWEVAGGMWVEPDCNLPSGEALIRHFLYGKDFVKKEFGVVVTEGLNPDSFGHGANLPAIFCGCGIRSNTISRPARECVNLPALFVWRSPDGSSLPVERTGGEYMAWTRPALERNIKESREGLEEIGYNKMAVFYGVGNHGGGPTIDNICTIREMIGNEPYRMEFGTLGKFYSELETQNLPEVTGELGRIYFGCYSSDRDIKQLNRKAEWTLLKAEAVLAMATRWRGDKRESGQEELSAAWKQALFNQFHDVLAGTSIEPARNEACREFHGAIAAAERIIQNGVQAIANGVETRGDGIPLLLINPTGAAFSGILETNLYVPRAQKKPLRMRDPKGAEIFCCESDYQNTSPEGRKDILFHADIPAYGYSVYRVIGEAPNDESVRQALYASQWELDNGVIRVSLDKQTGCPRSIVKGEKEILSGASAVRVFYDDRGSWGEDIFVEKPRGQFEAVKFRVVEANPLRAIVRVLMRYKQSEMRIDYILEAESDILKMAVRLHNCEKHRQIDLCIPTVDENPIVWTETAFLAEQKIDPMGENPEYYQHRFADVTAGDGSGLAVLNDSIYACMQIKNEYRLILSRSSAYARGGKGELEENLENAFMDQGTYDYELRLIAHDHPLSKQRLFTESDFLHMQPEYLGDNCHQGALCSRTGALMSVHLENAVTSCLKRSLSNPDALILRVFETEGKDGRLSLEYQGKQYERALRPFEIVTLRMEENHIVECDLLEEESSAVKEER